jgi:hypothetical protein
MATFASFDPTIPKVEVIGDRRPVLSLSVKTEVLSLDAEGRPGPAFLSRDYSREVIGAFRSTGALSAVVPQSQPHDLGGDVLVRRSVQNRTALLNLATAYLIPGVEDREIAMEIDLHDLASSRDVRVKRSYRFRVWYELLFLPIYPFYSPAAFEMKLSAWLFKVTASEALQKMLNPSDRAELP